jgi:KDO2-lipid IV(A) lauroyltransferase
MKNKILQITRLNLEYICVYLIYKLVSVLPTPFVSFLGGSIFKFIGPYTKTHRIVKRNYMQIFPSASKKQILKQSKLNWFNTGKTFLELFILPKIISANNKITINGLEYIKDVQNNNEQVIFIGIHESNWEILLPTIDKIGISVGGIYRHINNPYIDKLILKIRKKSIISNKSFYTPKGKQSAKEIIDGIKKGLSVVLLIDQKDSAGEIVPFFNIPTKTQIGFLKLAKKYNMKIIPVHNIRNKDNNFTIQFYPPLEKFSKELSDIDVMKKIHGIIEEWIKECPSNYFLQHNRFR